MARDDSLSSEDAQPRQNTVWAIAYSLDVIESGKRQTFSGQTAVIQSTNSLEDALQTIRDAWVGKTLHSPGCNSPFCKCDGEPHSAKVLGVRFHEAKIVTHLTDLNKVVTRMTTKKKEPSDG